MMRNEPSATLITLLRSTSTLLEHYGYSEHDPTLREIRSFLGRAIARLEAAAPDLSEWHIQLDGSRPQ
jgi:hypothetical protein